MTATAIPEKAKALTAGDLAAAIRARYEPPEWHLETEVTLANRRLDVVAFNLWTARQNRVVGFELKVSRGDWVRELDAFQKSEEWVQVVDAFYVVTPPKIIRPEELPAGWGHLELCGSRMMTRAHAAVKPIGTTLPREVVARFFTRLAQRATSAEREAERRARFEVRSELDAQIRREITKGLEVERADAADTRRQLDELLTALGIDRHSWQLHERALRAAGVFARYEGDARLIAEGIRRAADGVGRHHRALTEALAELTPD